MFYYHKTAVSRLRHPSGLDSIPAMPIHHLGPQAGRGFPRRPQQAPRPTSRGVHPAGRTNLPSERPLNDRFQLALQRDGFGNQTIGIHQPHSNQPNCVILVKQLETVIGNVSLHETYRGVASYSGVPNEYLGFLCNHEGSITSLKTKITTLRHQLQQNPGAVQCIDVGGGFMAVGGMDANRTMQVRVVHSHEAESEIIKLSATLASTRGDRAAAEARMGQREAAAALHRMHHPVPTPTRPRAEVNHPNGRHAAAPSPGRHIPAPPPTNQWHPLFQQLAGMWQQESTHTPAQPAPSDQTTEADRWGIFRGLDTLFGQGTPPTETQGPQVMPFFHHAPHESHTPPTHHVATKEPSPTDRVRTAAHEAAETARTRLAAAAEAAQTQLAAIKVAATDWFNAGNSPSVGERIAGNSPSVGERITWWESKNEAVAAFTQKMAAPEGTLPSGWRNKLEGFISDYVTGPGIDMITQNTLKEIPAPEWPNLMVYTTTSDSKMAIMSYNPDLIKRENEKWMCKCPQTRTPISINQVMSFHQLVYHPDAHHQLYPALINNGILPNEPINPPKRSFMARVKGWFFGG